MDEAEIKICEGLVDQHPEWNQNKSVCQYYAKLIDSWSVISAGSVFQNSYPDTFQNPETSPLFNTMLAYHNAHRGIERIMKQKRRND